MKVTLGGSKGEDWESMAMVSFGISRLNSRNPHHRISGHADPVPFFVKQDTTDLGKHG